MCASKHVGVSGTPSREDPRRGRGRVFVLPAGSSREEEDGVEEERESSCSCSVLLV